MTERHDTDPLEALLAEPHVDDDGFTERALTALPRPRSGRRWAERLTLLFTCVGLFVGLVVFPGAELINLTVKGLMDIDPSMPQLTILSLITLATAGWAAWQWLARE